jgi:hypothetical protein
MFETNKYRLKNLISFSTFVALESVDINLIYLIQDGLKMVNRIRIFPRKKYIKTGNKI